MATSWRTLLLLLAFLRIIAVASLSEFVYSVPTRDKQEGAQVEGSCSVVDHGAVGDNHTDDTDAIQNTIDFCHEKYPGFG